MTNAKKISVQIIEDYSLIRKSLRFFLEKDSEIEVTGCFERADNFFSQLKNKDIGNDIDILILDLKLNGLNGYELLKQIKTEKPELKILVICTVIPTEDVFSSYTFDANGFCPLELQYEKIIEIIKAIHNNNNFEILNKYCSIDTTPNRAIGIDKINH